MQILCIGGIFAADFPWRQMKYFESRFEAQQLPQPMANLSTFRDYIFRYI